MSDHENAREARGKDEQLGREHHHEGMSDEDRAWLETDLSRLGEYDAYELTEEQLADEQPIRYVPGLGLIVEDEAAGGPPHA